MEILLKSVMERPQYFDGPRYLIESTWPDTVQDLDLCPYLWIKALVPSYTLMEMAQKHRWQPEHFQHAYWAELKQPASQQAIQSLLMENSQGRITFLYAAASSMRSSAYFLKKYLCTYGWPVPAEVVQLQPLALAA